MHHRFIAVIRYAIIGCELTIGRHSFPGFPIFCQESPTVYRQFSAAAELPSCRIPAAPPAGLILVPDRLRATGPSSGAVGLSARRDRRRRRTNPKGRLPRARPSHPAPCHQAGGSPAGPPGPRAVAAVQATEDEAGHGQHSAEKVCSERNGSESELAGPTPSPIETVLDETSLSTPTAPFTKPGMRATRHSRSRAQHQASRLPPPTDRQGSSVAHAGL